MLPVPVSWVPASQRTTRSAFTFIPSRRDPIRRNNATISLAFVAILSLVLNMRYWLNARHNPFEAPPRIPVSISNTLTRDSHISHASHLIIVLGHGIWKGCDPQWRGDHEQWLLGPEAKDRGASVRLYFSHIVRGAELAMNDPHAILIFSGGQTLPDSSITEAQSYHRLAHESNVFQTSHSYFERAHTEDYALDSFQNLLFSIARFHEIVGAYPQRVTAIGFAMKEDRFRQLHRAALRWPENKFDYIGLDLPGDSSNAKEGEVPCPKYTIFTIYTHVQLSNYSERMDISPSLRIPTVAITNWLRSGVDAILSFDITPISPLLQSWLVSSNGVLNGGKYSQAHFRGAPEPMS